jgi:hypothetical protein
MEEKNISAEESLQLIEQMLGEARNKFYNNGFALLFWGILISLSCLGQFIMIKMGYPEQSNYIWPVAIGIGMVITFLYYGVYAKRSKQFSRSDSSNGILWIGFAITFMVLAFLCIYLKVNPAGFIWCLTGFAMFASGGIYKFKPLFAGAFVFWITAIVCVLLKDDLNTLWIAALSMLLGYIVPGFLLWKKAKKEAHV